MASWASLIWSCTAFWLRREKSPTYSTLAGRSRRSPVHFPWTVYSLTRALPRFSYEWTNRTSVSRELSGPFSRNSIWSGSSSSFFTRLRYSAAVQENSRRKARFRASALENPLFKATRVREAPVAASSLLAPRSRREFKYSR